MAYVELFLTTLYSNPAFGLDNYYRFEGNSNDSKASLNGTDTAITYNTTNGKVNQGAGFNGTSSQIQFSSSLFAYDRAQPFTITFWIKTSSSASCQLMNNFSTQGMNFYFNATGDNQIQIELINTNSTNGIKVVTGNISLHDGAFHMITVTYDGSSTAAGVKLYKDGASQSLSTVEDNLSATILGGSFYLGSANGSMFTSAAYDELAFFHTALTSQNVSDYYNGLLVSLNNYPKFINQAVKRASFY
jgi:hypothetical protein